MRGLVLIFLFISFSFANNLQDAINKAPIGSTLKLSAGIYSGKIIINKPIKIIGKSDNVVIKGDGIGRVIVINSSNVVLKNLTITDSGERMENLDSAIFINKVKNCKIINCKILNSLYGIDMVMVNNSVISNNYITSKKRDIGLRGDALKIWYSNNNIIKNNIIDTSRDVTLTYSNDNKLMGNIFKNSRFGTHISLSKNNLLKSNIYQYNSVGIMVMGAKNTKIINNKIKSSKGAAGIGVVVAGVNNFALQNNKISFNAQGVYIDSSHKERGMQRYIKNNEISYNKEAIHFHGAIKNNVIKNNKIFGNIDDIVQDIDSKNSYKNIIEYNYWDRYTGFDRDNDGIGDTTHKIFQYADKLWHYNHKVKFFYATPAISLLNFLSTLAPFIKPNLLLEDKKPIMKYYKTTAK